MVAIHPLPILNISDHVTRARLTGGSVIGALLGTRDSIVNSFEYTTDTFETRRDQFKTVFPSLEVVGWYTTGKPTTDIFEQHKAFTAQVEGAILVLFDISLDFPVRAYETNLAGDSLIEAEYSIETGEAERIAVDATRVGQDDQVAGHLTTQRNAIAMLYERMQVIQKHVALNPDLAILRQVSSLLATLPIMDADSFRDELHTEYSDVRLTEYLSTVLKQLDSLNDYADLSRPIEGRKDDRRRR